MQQLDILNDIEENEVVEVLENDTWKEDKLEDLSKYISRGITPSYIEEDGVRVLNQKCIRNGQVSLKDSRLTDPNKKKITDEKILKLYDILINSTGQGTLGRIGQILRISEKMTFDSHVTVVRPNQEKINPIFLGYYLKKIQPIIEDMAEGSTGQTELSREKVKLITIPVPTNKEQEKIAKMLSSLDDKIELNQKMNKTLEEMAQAIFKHWFIDFEFPNEEGKPYKSSGGEMVDSELGDIPKGWEIKPIKDIGVVVTGKTPSSKFPEHFGYDVPFVTPTDFKNYGKIIFDSIRYISNEGMIFYKNKILPKNSVIVTCIGSDMGKVAVTKVECLTNQQINSIIVSSSLSDYLYYSLTNIYEKLKNIATSGSTMPIINKSDFERIKFLIPKFETILNFSKILDSINLQLEKNIKENKTLIEIRDSLLPKLMNGDIRTNSSPNPFSPAFKGSKEGGQES